MLGRRNRTGKSFYSRPSFSLDRKTSLSPLWSFDNLLEECRLVQEHKGNSKLLSLPFIRQKDNDQIVRHLKYLVAHSPFQVLRPSFRWQDCSGSVFICLTASLYDSHSEWSTHSILPSHFLSTSSKKPSTVCSGEMITRERIQV